MYISDFFIQDSTSLGRLSNKCIHIAHSVLRRVSKPTHMATSNHHSVVIPSSAFPYTSFNLVWDFKPTGSVVPPVSLSRTVPETLPYASVGLPLRVAPLPLPFCTCRPCIFLPFLYARADPVPGKIPGPLLPSPLFHKELPYHPLPPKKKSAVCCTSSGMPSYCLQDCHYFYRTALRGLNISTYVSPLYA